MHRTGLPIPTSPEVRSYGGEHLMNKVPRTAVITAAATFLPAAEVEARAIPVHPCDLAPHDCVCSIDLPAKAGRPPVHLDWPDHPEVLNARTFPGRNATVVAFLDRPAEEWPAEATVRVYRRGGAR